MSKIEQRPFAKMYRKIWSDEEFLNLDEGPQRLFMLLLSHPSTTLAGTLSLRIRPWSRLARDSTPDAVRANILTLDERCFVVADENTEELLIRTLMKNDTLWNRSPKTQLGILRHCLKAESPRIRLVMADEIEACLHMFTTTDAIDEQAKAALTALREHASEHASEHVAKQPHTAYRIPHTAYVASTEHPPASGSGAE
jgi:hypothetical protein